MTRWISAESGIRNRRTAVTIPDRSTFEFDDLIDSGLFHVFGEPMLSDSLGNNQKSIRPRFQIGRPPAVRFGDADSQRIAVQ